MYKITKLTDTRFDGAHPNGIGEGYQFVGLLAEPIEIGKPCKMVRSMYRWFHTSPVTKIKKKSKSITLITTVNSIYQLEKIEKADLA